MLVNIKFSVPSSSAVRLGLVLNEVVWIQKKEEEEGRKRKTSILFNPKHEPKRQLLVYSM